ncbi:MAG: hypothetical protein ACQEWF_23370 [Bacillota bacterium]
MLTIEERHQLKQLMALVSKEEEVTSNIDVTNRTRDEKGRFLPEQRAGSRLESVRPIKLVKVKGSYGAFNVKTRWLSTGEKTHLYIVCGIIILAIMF